MSAPAVNALSERALIERIRTRLPPPPDWLRVGPGDDAAVLEPARNRVEVVTTDVSIEGVHFDRAFVPPGAIGHRAVAANLSDIAAMGAEPRALLLSLTLPLSFPLDDFDRLVEGAAALAAAHRTAIVGGNLSRSPGPLVVDVTAIGSVHRRKVLLRSGARPGDLVYLSGTIGAARAGLEQCREQPSGPEPAAGSPRARYLRPEARVRLGMLLGRTGAASACMDLSDGLADGLRQVAAASGVALQTDAALVPIDREARTWFEARGQDPVEAAVTGGDDYELLFTVPRRRQGPLAALVRTARASLTRIGVVRDGSGATLVRGGRASEVPAGFSHFGS